VDTLRTADPRKTFGAAVLEVARENPSVVVLSADSGGSSGFGKFAEEYPDRYYEFGIMEQGVVGISSGLATTGKIPIFCAIAPFVTCRPYEMLRNDLGYMRQNVKIVGRNGGISYSDLGSTHHSLEDYAIMRMIPEMTVLAPQDPSEIKTAVRAMIAHDGPVYMRIGNYPIPYLFEEKPFDIGKGHVIREGTDVTIIVTGTMAKSVVDAAENLEKRGIAARVIAMPTVWPVDRDLIEKSAREIGKIVTVEEHYTVGGLGTIVQEVCAETTPVSVLKIGMPHIYATSGPYDELLSYYGLDSSGIEKSVQAFVKD